MKTEALFRTVSVHALKTPVGREILRLLYTCHREMEGRLTGEVFSPRIDLRGHINKVAVIYREMDSFQFTFRGTLEGEAVTFILILQEELLEMSHDDALHIINCWCPFLPDLHVEELRRN
ncbi:MAG: hypothetical protein AAB381_02440 [Patescibacteria group bacterium]